MRHTLFGTKFLAAFATALISIASASAQTFTVPVRNEKGRLTEEKIELTDLTSSVAFEGTHFKILEKDTDRVVRFDGDPNLVRHAATVYYHLEKARATFDDLSQKIPALQALATQIAYPVTIRIEMDLPYSDVSHFVRDGSKQYNNSLTIPASDMMKATDVPAWGNEIWFYASKKEKIPSFTQQLTAVLNQGHFKKAILQQLLYPEIVKIGATLSYGIKPVWSNHLVSLGTSILISEVVIPFLAVLAKPFSATQYIDTAMIPEVVYHEFAHLVFEGQLGLFRPTSIVEGYPNYFAYQVSGLTRLAQKTKKAAKGYLPKNAKSKAKFSFDQDRSLMAATGSFVFSLLYQLQESFGEEGNQIIYGALAYLDRSSEIQLDFERAIIQSIQDNSQKPMVQILKAHEVFQTRGL
ncbi:MAG: hypothetical protein JNL01_16695 [Bdellovibrionales bacterium]|nr:hypothetical protein [Bdellovibrionales bacterium]